MTEYAVVVSAMPIDGQAIILCYCKGPPGHSFAVRTKSFAWGSCPLYGQTVEYIVPVIHPSGRKSLLDARVPTLTFPPECEACQAPMLFNARQGYWVCENPIHYTHRKTEPREEGVWPCDCGAQKSNVPCAKWCSTQEGTT